MDVETWSQLFIHWTNLCSSSPCSGHNLWQRLPWTGSYLGLFQWRRSSLPICTIPVSRVAYFPHISDAQICMHPYDQLGKHTNLRPSSGRMVVIVGHGVTIDNIPIIVLVVDRHEIRDLNQSKTTGVAIQIVIIPNASFLGRMYLAEPFLYSRGFHFST